MNNKHILTDTGFWIELYDKTSPCHSMAVSTFNRIEDCRIFFPWPIFYEVLRTRFIKSKPGVTQFEKHLHSLTIDKINDEPYRDKALIETINLAKIGKRKISLADMVVRHILQDANLRVDLLVTNNGKDFHDVCQRRRIRIESVRQDIAFL